MIFSRKKKKTLKRKSHRDQSFAWQIIKGVLKLIGLVIFFVCVYYVTRAQSLTISEVTVTGGETIPHESVRRTVLNELDGTYFRLIPKKFSYLYPRDHIQNLIENVERVYNVEVYRTNRKTLSISFDEYLPHALWCSVDMKNEPCYFIDQSGFAFAKAPHLLGGTLVRHYVQHNEYEEGDVIEEATLSAIDLFILQTGNVLNFRINTLNYLSDEDVSFEVNGGGMILVSLKKDLDETLENITVVLNSPEFEHIEPGNFKYIDARFDNKIFVNENIATTTEETQPETEELPE